MAAWPASLPQKFALGDFQEQTVDILLRTTMDAGPDKVRPLYTAAPTDFAGSMVLTVAQRATLETFYDTTLAFGTATFDWVHPVTLAAATLQFRARPGYDAVAGGYVRASLAIRLWPA